MKVLIAEDDEFLASAYKLKLGKAGFEIQIANDGQEALNILETFKPEVILLDLVMPNKDGFTTLEEIKANQNYNTIPVIVASNLGQQEDIDRAMQLGATDYVIKSDLSMNAVIDKIQKAIAPTS